MADRPTEPVSINALRDPVSVERERLEARLERFATRSNAPGRRSGLYAVLGALLVVGFGVWGFRKETNTRLAPVHAESTGAAVMVVLPAR